MQTPALSVQVGERRSCLYYTGRRHAGENLERLLAQREPGRANPLGRSAALPSNNAEESSLVRGHCWAQGRRKFRELAEACPAQSAVVVEALQAVSDPEEKAREEQLRVQGRWAYHQPDSTPIRDARKTGLEQPREERRVAPKSRLGKALT
jgi:transposase